MQDGARARKEVTMTTTVPATPGTRPSLSLHTGTLRLPNRVPPAPAATETDAVPPPATASAAAPIAVPSDPVKPVQARREQEEQQAAVLRRRQELDETLAALRDRWPALFTAPVPLAIGIERKIQQALGEDRFSKLRLRRALHCWTRRTGYLVTIAEGRRRRDLDGSDAGEPEEAHRAHAREMVAERRAKCPPHQQQSGPQPMPFKPSGAQRSPATRPA